MKKNMKKKKQGERDQGKKGGVGGFEQICKRIRGGGVEL